MNQAVGGQFPDLALKDQTGQEARHCQRMTEGKFPLIVVFYRGYW